MSRLATFLNDNNGNLDDGYFPARLECDVETFDPQLKTLLAFYLGPRCIYTSKVGRVVKYLLRHYWNRHFDKLAGAYRWVETRRGDFSKYFMDYTQNLLLRCVETRDLIEQGAFPAPYRSLKPRFGTKVNGRLLDTPERWERQLGGEQTRLQEQLKYLYITHAISIDQIAHLLHLREAAVTELLDQYGYRQFLAAMQAPPVRFLSTGFKELDGVLGGRGLRVGELYEFYQEYTWKGLRLLELLHLLVQRATLPPSRGGLGGCVLFIGREGSFSWDYLQRLAGDNFQQIARRVFFLPCKTFRILRPFCERYLTPVGLRNHIRLVCIANLTEYTWDGAAILTAAKALAMQGGGIGVICNPCYTLPPSQIFGQVRVEHLSMTREFNGDSQEPEEPLYRVLLERPPELAPLMDTWNSQDSISPSRALPRGITRRTFGVFAHGRKRKYAYYSQGHLQGLSKEESAEV